MAAPRRVLPDDVIGEIFLRLPPDNPACFFRAAAASQAWRAFLTDPATLRRYRQLHTAPPVLGFLQHARIITTAIPSPPLRRPDIECALPLELDCRHGRVLFHTMYPLGFNVWNPVTGSHHFLPYHHNNPQLPFCYSAGAVICAADGCDHLDCGEGPFRVVFVATVDDNFNAVVTRARLYSSESGSWTAPTTVHPGALMEFPDVMGPSLLAGDALYFTLDLLNNRTILRYDLGGGALSVMEPPPLVRTRRDTFLVTGEDGGLGVAAVEGSSLHLWSWKADGGWAPPRVIDLLEMSLPFTIGDPITKLNVIGFAEMSGAIFVSADDVISSVQMRSGSVSIFSRTPDCYIIFPFEKFYTPGMQGA